MKRIGIILLIFILCCSFIFSTCSAFADDNAKLQIYFQPEIMDPDTGEILVNVNIRNVDASIPKYSGDICSVVFSFEYDAENFNLDTKEDFKFIVDENTLIKSEADVELKVEGNKIVFRFIDSTLQDNLIGIDGTLCRFKLFAKDAEGLWNSFDKYPIRFIPGSVGFITYHLPSYSVGQFDNFEAIDGIISGYNTLPDLSGQPVDKYISFTAGEASIKVDEEVIQTDATPFIQDSVMMIPLRYFAENVGMDVYWNGELSLAYASAKNKTFCVSLNNSYVYINAVRCAVDTNPVEIGGRTFIPVTAINKLYENAQVSFDDVTSSVSVYVP